MVFGGLSVILYKPWRRHVEKKRLQRAHFEPMPTEDRDGHEDDNVEEEEESVQDRTKDSKKDVGVSIHPVETTDEAGPAGPSTQRP